MYFPFFIQKLNVDKSRFIYENLDKLEWLLKADERRGAVRQMKNICCVLKLSQFKCFLGVKFHLTELLCLKT